MKIELSSDQQAWLEARVADGEFPSIEAAVGSLLDAQRVWESALEEDDLEWAKPLVDEALAQIERGEVLTAEEFKARNAARRARLTR